jgi:hypothetical protein
MDRLRAIPAASASPTPHPPTLGISILYHEGEGAGGAGLAGAGKGAGAAESLPKAGCMPKILSLSPIMLFLPCAGAVESLPAVRQGGTSSKDGGTLSKCHPPSLSFSTSLSQQPRTSPPPGSPPPGTMHLWRPGSTCQSTPRSSRLRSPPPPNLECGTLM